jgi:hypothetical protein
VGDIGIGISLADGPVGTGLRDTPGEGGEAAAKVGTITPAGHFLDADLPELVSGPVEVVDLRLFKLSEKQLKGSGDETMIGISLERPEVPAGAEIVCRLRAGDIGADILEGRSKLKHWSLRELLYRRHRG